LNVLLDLDGTLTDPAQGITACIAYAMRELGVACPHQDVLRQFIGPPLQNTFAELLGSGQRVDDAVRLYRERFSETGMYENAVYPGMGEALGRLSASGAQLFLATSKPRVFAARILEHFGLSSHFVSVHGSELDGMRADKAELIAYIIRCESLTAGNTVMIGDRKQDMEGAKSNSVLPVGALWGYGSRQELTAAGAEVILEQPAELSWERLADVLK